MKRYNIYDVVMVVWATNFYFGDRMSQKGGSSMNTTVVLDWKFVVAIGATTAVIILAKKMNPAEAKEVLTRVVDTHAVRAIALTGDC